MKKLFKKLCALCLCFGLGIGAAAFVNADVQRILATQLSPIMTFNTSSGLLIGTSADTADSQTFLISPAGGLAGPAGDNTRAGYIELGGNDNASLHGGILIAPGIESSSSFLDLRNGGNAAGNAIQINKYDGTHFWYLGSTASGNILNDATNGGNIIFQKGQTGVRSDIGTLAGAGSTQADAAAIVHTVTRVTGANGTVGVNLPALATIGVGARVTVINSDVTNALKVYGNAAGETIDGQSGTTAISVAAKLFLDCFAYDASNWYCDKGVLPF